MKGRDGKYDDMLDMPCPTSERHPRMGRSARAAQFAPFAALSGFEELVSEESRHTENRIFLAEEEKLRINDMLLWAIREEPRPTVSVTFFFADEVRSGGSYVTRVGTLLEINEHRRIIVMSNGEEIPIDEVIRISEE